jgi:hypothetical protein
MREVLMIREYMQGKKWRHLKTRSNEDTKKEIHDRKIRKQEHKNI